VGQALDFHRRRQRPRARQFQRRHDGHTSIVERYNQCPAFTRSILGRSSITGRRESILEACLHSRKSLLRLSVLPPFSWTLIHLQILLLSNLLCDRGFFQIQEKFKGSSQHIILSKILPAQAVRLLSLPVFLFLLTSLV
jgi:hypothetical protein